MNSAQDLSYFSLRLQELLKASFPEKADDTEFILQRSALAEQAYENAFKGGNQPSACFAIADNTLFEGLYFSKYDTVFQVVSGEFDTLMADQQLRPFALKMLPVCEPVFASYVLVDDFAYSPEFELLYTELTGTIATWIEDHGLQ